MFYSVPQPHKYISGYETSNDIGFIFVYRAENTFSVCPICLE